MKHFYYISTVVLFAIATVSCKKDTVTDNFDKTGMFTNYADNLILPAYNDYGTALNNFENALDTFTATPDTVNLAALQQTILSAYTAWQYCEVYNQTAPADAVQSIYNTNYYPADTNAINLNIQSNNNSQSFIQTTAITQKGFPALDYLFFSRNLSQAQLLERFTSDADAGSRNLYVASLLSEVKRVQQAIVTDWSGYRATFINAIGTDAGSAFSALVNTIAERTDNFKRHQVGIPAGYVGNTATSTLLPTKAQAYFSNKSIDYMLITLNNLKDVMNGKSGPGLYDYLKHLNATSTIGGDLADDIMDQIDVCIQKVNDCGPDYAALIQTDKPKADALFLEAKKLLVLMKVDVPSAIGVSISYTDNDGD